MNWIEIISIFAAAMAVSFGAIGPGARRGTRGRRRNGCHRPPAGGRRHHIADAVRRSRDDRDDGDLLSGDRAAVVVRQPVHPLRPCISIGGRWRSRPSMSLFSSGFSPGSSFGRSRTSSPSGRQEANKLLADAAAARQQAADARADADKALRRDRRRAGAADRGGAQSCGADREGKSARAIVAGDRQAAPAKPKRRSPGTGRGRTGDHGSRERTFRRHRAAPA